ERTQLGGEPLAEGLGRHLRGGQPQHGELARQEAAASQVDEGREELAFGQVPGASEDGHGTGRAGLAAAGIGSRSGHVPIVAGNRTPISRWTRRDARTAETVKGGDPSGSPPVLLLTLACYAQSGWP